MSNIAKSTAHLSPAKKRALLAQLLQQKGKLEPYPLSFAQRRLWFLEQWEPHSPLYNLSSVLHIKGPLQQSALQDSLNEIIRRHGSLRTIFDTRDDQPVQFILPLLTISLPLIDLSSLSATEREAALHSLLLQEETFPFDLTEGPLVRATLLLLQEAEHILFLSMHHIISDGWSMGIVFRELACLYNAYIQGQPSPLPDLPIQYINFALWQHEWLQGSVLVQQQAYWRTQLARVPTLLTLPTDHPRPASQTFDGSDLPFTLSPALSDQLRALSRREGVTIFMLLLSAFAILLARYSGQDDLVIGTPIANRTRTEIEGLIGFFVNTLPLRIDLSGNPDFHQLLTRVREMTLDAYIAQDMPFEKLIEDVAPARSLSHSPLFQAMFILQNIPQTTEQMRELTVRRMEGVGTTAMFDLTLALIDSEQGFHGGFNYKTTLFEQATIAHMTAHFQTLLEDIVAHPRCQVAELALLSQSERSLLLKQWDYVPEGSAVDCCVHTLFEEQAASIPGATAIVFEGATYTYQELNQRSNQLARLLMAQGVKPAQPLAIMLGRGPAQIIALFAILKVGCPFVCFDDQTPALRLQQILVETAPPCILTEVSCFYTRPELAAIIGEQATIVLLDTPTQPTLSFPVITCDQCAAYPDTNLYLAGSTLAPAYIAYTSGSTGQPKGIIQSHRNFARFIHWFSTYFHIQPDSRIAQWPSITFDPALAEIFSTLCSGATLFLLNKTLSTDPEAMASWLQQQRIHFLQTVPAFFRYMLPHLLQAHPGHDQAGQGPFPYLETLILTGDVLSVDLAADIVQHLGNDLTLYNLYGPTEVVLATSYAVREVQAGQCSIPVGRPIAGSQVFILDQSQQMCPLGVIGEIYVRGNYVSDGYFKQPQESQQAFLQNPLHHAFPERVYRTGDLGRWLPDGTIEFFGRRDQQVKIRGMRVELEEIEAVLQQYEGVRSCAVMAHPDEQGEQRLVAYITSAQLTLHAPVSAIQIYLRQHLPDYMCPVLIITLEALPLTASGKVNRLALPTPDWKHLDIETSYVAPRTPQERIIADIWSELLHVSQIGVYDNFFALGGHSLLATQVVARIRNLFTQELSLRSLFETPTVAGLAYAMEQRRAIDQDVQVSPIVYRQQVEYLPLSFAQQRLWFLDQLLLGTTLYVLPLFLRINGMLDLVALEKSLHDIARRHEILRTYFVLVDGQPTQQIVEQSSLVLSITDISHLTVKEREQKIQNQMREEEIQPFDLAREPLWRASIVRCQANEYMLLLSMHHIISDAWSTSIFFYELAHFYAYHAHGKRVNLPSLPIQYADFALWQRQWLQGEVLERQLSYWRHQLTAVPSLLELPLDHVRPPLQTHRGAELSFRLSQELTQRLNVLSRKEGTTLFMTLLAAFALLLASYSGQDDLVIGTPIANRRHTEVEGLIGFFVNTLALRVRLVGNASFRQLLASVREVTLGAYTHQDVPFEKLVEELTPDRHLDRSPLFQVMFVLQNAVSIDPHLADLTLTPLDSQHITARFDLTLMMADTAESLQATFEYNTDIFDDITIKRMQAHFQTLLEQAVAQPERRLNQFSLLSAQEYQQIIHDWNQPSYTLPSTLDLLAWLEQPAYHTPEAPALLHGQQTLSFCQMHSRANVLAHFLRSRLRSPHSIIGICLPRSLDLPIALLACLKAGVAYLPLDPAFPAQRLSFMIADAGVSLLLTHSSLLPSIQPLLAARAISIVCLDQDADALHAFPHTPPPRLQELDPLAYIIYTSGSTGQPKGVEISVNALTTFLHSMQSCLQIRRQDRWLAITTLSFDIAALELLLPLCSGAELILAPQELVADGPGLARLLHERQITVMQATPITWRLLLDAGWSGQPTSLQIVCGGEAFPSDLLQPLQERGLRLWNVYGPTEATIWATAHDLSKQESTGRIPLGHPLANTRCYVLNDAWQPVPVGVIGEIYLGGEGVARGYVRRPALTGERFIPDPFSTHPGARLYRSGDLGRWSVDGVLEYIGRVDGQVKLHGHRIELGEIEVVLCAQVGVSAAVVQVQEVDPGVGLLVAYVVAEETEKEGQVQQWRKALQARLPDYMVPAMFVPLSHLPLTTNGKIDRRKLPEPTKNLRAQATEYVEPQNDLERTIASIWQEVLHQENVSSHDNFFDLGGHSLLLAKVYSRLLSLISECDLSMIDLFRYPTISLLADYIAQHEQAGTDLRQRTERTEIYKKRRHQRLTRQQTRHIRTTGEER